jgi:hypothetical protein
MSPFLTSKENIVVNLIYEWLGESRTNRTYDEYMEIASRFPKVAACHAHVNQRLREMADAGNAPLDGTLGMRIFQPRYRGKLCALRYSRWACHRTAAAGAKYLISLAL